MGARDGFQALVAAAVEASDDAVVTAGPDGKITSWNRGATKLYGYSADEALGADLSIFLSPAARRMAREALRGIAAGQVSATFETEHQRKDGSTVHVSVSLSRFDDRDGNPGAVGIARDISSRKRAEAAAARAAATLAAQASQLRNLAFHDSLTGLPNRVLLQDRLDTMLARRPPRPVSVLLLDLDDFKSVNDLAGHAIGDRVLVEIAARLQSTVRPADTVARLGGDEFAIVLDGPDDPEGVARRVLDRLGEPVELEGARVVPRATMGIALDNEAKLTTAELLRRADLALYAGKDRCRGSFAWFDEAMAEAFLRRADLEVGLREAVDRREIVVHYQPIVHVDAERVTRLEALVRWQRPDGLVAPADFLAIAETSGLILGIGREVLAETCRQTRAWLRDPAHSIAVNVSARQLQEPAFGEDMLEFLKAAEVPASQLVIEVTETLFLEADSHVIGQLELLRSAGIRVAIDDFGTGFSSLGRLQALPVDAVKIDRTFVSEIVTGKKDFPILTSMVVMAHNLGLEVTAEGVETAEQAERLTALGVEYLQGFYFARPQPMDVLRDAQDGADAAMQHLGFADPSSDERKPPVVLAIDDDPVIRAVVRASLAGSGVVLHEAASVGEARALVEAVRPDCMLVDLYLPDGSGIALIEEVRANPANARSAIVIFTSAADRETKQLAFAAGADDYVVKSLLGKNLAARLRGAMRAARVPAERRDGRLTRGEVASTNLTNDASM